MALDLAIQMARDEALDLVEVSPNASPPVCRIMDFGKYLFEINKKGQNTKRKTKRTQVKEIKFRPKGNYSINSEKKFFPGYVLVKMFMNDDTWHLVRNVPKVSNFLGTKDKPIAISEREVSKLLQDITEGVDNPKPKFEYEIGEQIKVSDGPFASFSGVIEEVDSSRQKLKVSVSIFGRPTPLELDYSQVVKG